MCVAKMVAFHLRQPHRRAKHRSGSKSQYTMARCPWYGFLCSMVHASAELCTLLRSRGRWTLLSFCWLIVAVPICVGRAERLWTWRFNFATWVLCVFSWVLLNQHMVLLNASRRSWQIPRLLQALREDFTLFVNLEDHVRCTKNEE